MEKQWLLGKYISQLMEDKGWNQRRLSKEAKLSPPYIGYIIRGSSKTRVDPPELSIDTIIRLSDALNVPYTKLVSAYLGQDPDKSPDNTPPSETYKNAIQGFVSNLPKEDKFAILDQLPREELEKALQERFGPGKLVRKDND